MNRKGLTKLVILIACMTFALSVYTVVALLFSGPKTTNYTLVLLDGQTVKLTGGKVSLTGDVDGLVYDKETGVYTAVNADSNSVDTVKSITATVKKNYGKKAIYDIKVYRVGNGTVNDPYNVNNAQVLCDLRTKSGANLANYNVVYDIDLKDVDWKPFGTIAEEFKGSFVGNGYKISNMSINVTNENRNDFIIEDPYNTDEKYFTVGFFGVTWDAKISGVNLVDFNINIAPDIILPDGSVFWDIGALVAYAHDTQIEGVEGGSFVSGTITETSFGITKGATGGLVGELRKSQISNYNVEVSIVSQKTGAYVGGLVGYAKKLNSSPKVGLNEIDNEYENSIKNCTVKAKVEADLTGVNTSVIAGICAQARNITVENVLVEGFTVTKKANTSTAVYNNIVAGAFGYINGVDYADGTLGYANVKNVTVKDMSADINKVLIAGFAMDIESSKVSILNSSVIGTTVLNGDYVAGFAIYNYGSVVYDEEFEGEYAVQAEVLAYSSGAGFATYNFGQIKNIAETRQKISVKVVWTGNKFYGSAIATEDVETFSVVDQVVTIAGVASYMAGDDAEISGFDVKAELVNGLNMAGIAGQVGIIKVVDTTEVDGVTKYAVKYLDKNMQFTNENTLSGGKIANCSVESKFATLTYTYRVGGAVCELGKGTIVDNVVSTIKLKAQDSNSTLGACAAVVGGLVAQVCDDNVTIINSSVVNSEIEVNHSDIISITSDIKYKWNIVGGLVGLVRAYNEGVDNYFVTNLTLTNNAVSKTTISSTVDLTDYAVKESEVARSVTNGIAGFIGVIQSLTETITENTVNEVSINVTSRVATENLVDLKIASKSITDDVSGIEANPETNTIKTI